ncbi:THO complex subunit 1 [Lecanosticta acicola]|uniref:THO complex subunit 1 n=1 Tax=Lecanosticta acicola TaxID=111012 RepID=A0AAI8Z132_9PEZI|nr:THO complex subunit 1 [Lecanosticta acicola]
MAATTAAELQSVVDIGAKLRAILAHARSLKQETTVDPVLPTAELSADIEALHQSASVDHDQSYRFSAVETAAREIFYSLITSVSIEDPAFVDIWNFLDILQVCGDSDQCDGTLVCYLLEELLDSQTTEGCRTVFDYLDSRRERLAQKDFHKKNLIFLRSCNELLRRLSRAEDAIFCGRVFFFLFQTFPLGDKSSVNLRGEFHTENTTKFDASEAQIADGGDMHMDVDSEPKPDTPAGQEHTTHPSTPTKAGSKPAAGKGTGKRSAEEEILSTSDLYPIFWRLQHDFSEPTRLFDPSSFDAFKKGLGHTITKFKKTPTVVQTKAGEDDKRSTKGDMDENGVTGNGEDHLLDNYNPKYLTSRDLFELELSDLAFQRHILVQALILIDFLLSLTEKAKKRLAQKASANNKSLLYPFTLSDDDTKWAIANKKAINDYLSATGDGKQYTRVVETVLARDKNWVRWKIESCPSIVRGPLSTQDALAAMKGARDATRPRRIPDKPNFAMDLSFLDECGNGGLEALKHPSRFAVPTIDQLVRSVANDKLDLDMAVDDEEKSSLENAIANSKWRALRQARNSDLGMLEKVESSKDLEDMLEVREEDADAEVIEQSGDDTAPEVTITAETPAADAPQSLPKATEEDRVMEGSETS